MAGTSVKLGVEYSQFKQGMNEAQASVKTLSAALKANESQLKLTGDQEVYLKNKAQLLNQQIEAQKSVVANAMKALQEMENKGVKPTDSSYQKLKTSVYNATDQLNKMQTELKDVETGADNAGKEAGEMNTELQNIGKNVAWGNVAEGLDSITRKLESGARAAVNFGKKVLSSAKDSTQWADELQTTVKQYSDMGLTNDSLQRMQKVEDFIDAPVEAILNAKARMQKATATTGGVKAFEEILGINLNGKNTDDLFWETGEAILGMGEAFDKEAAAQQIFGRSWRELLPLFMTGREEYEKMLDEQNVLTDEQVKSLAEADDALKKAEQQITDLKNQFWAENADKITGLMQWFVDNKEPVVTALTAIGGAFGLMKLGSVAANLMKIISGFKTLGVIQGGEAAAATGGGFFARAKSAVGLEGIGGIGGLTAILAGFGWAKGQRNNNAAEVRGTDENLAAQSAGAEALLADYIRAQQAMANVDWDAAEEVYKAAQETVTQSYDKLMAAEGGAEALQAYSDWRQERSLGNMDWEMPENIARMTQTMEDSFAGQRQSNSEVTAALGNLEGLPAAVSAAVQAGMSNVTIIISEGAVGAIGRRTGKQFGNAVQALLK